LKERLDLLLSAASGADISTMKHLLSELVSIRSSAIGELPKSF
jgi:hypothetical protein